MIILTGDLVFSSRCRQTAAAVGETCRAAMSAAKALDLLREQPAALICVDLGAPGVNIAELVTELRAANAGKPIYIAAYAPHVHEAKLQAAQAAGCDLVLTRGQFDRQFGELVQSARLN